MSYVSGGPKGGHGYSSAGCRLRASMGSALGWRSAGFAALEPADEVFDFVQVRWIAFGAGDADEGEGFERGGEVLGVGMEAANAEREFSGTSFGRIGHDCRGIGSRRRWGGGDGDDSA